MNKRRVANWLQRFPPLLWGMRLAQRLLAPRQYVGAVGAVFNDEGHVLLVEHVFRTDFPWGLPGGWVERGEHPMDTVRREIEEELKLQVDVKRLLFTAPVGTTPKSSAPKHLGLAFYCRSATTPVVLTPEIISVAWVDPQKIEQELAPFQHQAILMGKQAFDHERAAVVSEHQDVVL